MNLRPSRFIYEHELMMLYKSILPSESKQKLVVTLQCYCGLRSCEAVGVKITDFSPDFRWLSVVNTKTGRQHEGKRPRVDRVPVPFFVQEDIKRYIRDNWATLKGNYLFASDLAQDSHYSKKSYWKWLGNKISSLGFTDVAFTLEYGKSGRVQNVKRIGSHSFRRFYITNVYNRSNHNLKLTKELARHVKIETTDKYINHFEVLEMAPGIVDRLSNAFNGSPCLPKNQKRITSFDESGQIEEKRLLVEVH